MAYNRIANLPKPFAKSTAPTTRSPPPLLYRAEECILLSWFSALSITRVYSLRQGAWRASRGPRHVSTTGSTLQSGLRTRAQRKREGARLLGRRDPCGGRPKGASEAALRRRSKLARAPAGALRAGLTCRVHAATASRSLAGAPGRTGAGRRPSSSPRRWSGWAAWWTCTSRTRRHLAACGRV